MKTIFITYNPDSQEEQTLAIRLYTIGVSSGFRMFLPDRSSSSKILDNETKGRISQANYVIMFSMEQLSTIVKQEIEFAASVLINPSKILVIYNKETGKNLSGNVVNLFTPILFDREHQDATLKKIIDIVKHKELEAENSKLRSSLKQLEVEKNNANALAALLGIGLGLFLLAASEK